MQHRVQRRKFRPTHRCRDIRYPKKRGEFEIVFALYSPVWRVERVELDNEVDCCCCRCCSSRGCQSQSDRWRATALTQSRASCVCYTVDHACDWSSPAL